MTADGDNKEMLEVLKRIEKQLQDIKYDLSDTKREMPQGPLLRRPLAGHNQSGREYKNQVELRGDKYSSPHSGKSTSVCRL